MLDIEKQAAQKRVRDTWLDTCLTSDEDSLYTLLLYLAEQIDELKQKLEEEEN